MQHYEADVSLRREFCASAKRRMSCGAEDPCRPALLVLCELWSGGAHSIIDRNLFMAGAGLCLAMRHLCSLAMLCEMGLLLL